MKVPFKVHHAPLTEHSESQDEEPSASAELVVLLFPKSPGSGADAEGGGRTGPRRNGTTAWMRITVPFKQVRQLLSTIERMSLATTWLAALMGTISGARTAGLPPDGVIYLVTLEIAVPVLLLWIFAYLSRRKMSRR